MLPIVFDDIVFRDHEKLMEACGGSLPHNAKRPSGESFYRFVDDAPIDLDRDFEPSPAAKHRGHPCIREGVSLYETFEAAEDVLQHMRQKVQMRPESKRLWMSRQIYEVMLSDGAFAILRTNRGQPSQDGEHWTWWPAHDWVRWATIGAMPVRRRR